tara:strand:- start:235 stop:1014 length:780 start_codon:yes stop_codon:yes gene_type:complete
VLPKIFKPFKSNINNLIRIGPKKDGGYVIDKRAIKKTKKIISCGLNDDWEFEKEFLKINPKCKIIAYDHTVNKEFWVKRFKKDIISLLLFKKIKLEKILDVFKYLNYLKFFEGENRHIIKKVVNYERKENEIAIKNILKKQHNLILKIDIEGNEYNILRQLNKEFRKINLLIIEFHNIHKNLNKIKNFVKKTKFKIIHIHGNNYAGINKNNDPKVVEMTFINSKKFKISKNKSNFNYPIIGLDYRNLKRRPDIELKFHE